MISNQAVEQAAYDIMGKAAIDIPEDYLGGIKKMIGTEKVQLSCYVLQTMVENWEAATEDRRPMCADTGLPRYYVKVGNDARIDGGFVGVERALRSATARATHDIPLRPNRVHPLWRTEHNNNVGINAPEIEWSFEPDVEWIEAMDYAVDPARGERFYDAIRKYWPDLPDGALAPGYAGIRPKLGPKGSPPADFVIQGPADHGVPGLVNLFGIESPGLTASLAIAELVAGLVQLGL